MSFSIYVNAFENEEWFHFPTAHLRSRFAPYLIRDDDGLWAISFDQGASKSDMYVNDGIMTAGFAVNRPPADIEFWSIIAGILSDLPCVLYWPGGGAVVGSLKTLPHLPKDMVESLGLPFVSTDAEQIRQYVRDNS